MTPQIFIDLPLLDELAVGLPQVQLRLGELPFEAPHLPVLLRIVAEEFEAEAPIPEPFDQHSLLLQAFALYLDGSVLLQYHLFENSDFRLEFQILLSQAASTLCVLILYCRMWQHRGIGESARLRCPDLLSFACTLPFTTVWSGLIGLSGGLRRSLPSRDKKGG